MPQYTIEIVDRRSSPIVDHGFLEEVVNRALREQRVDFATISLALVDDTEIRDLNRRFLGHDYPTDVISFLLNEPSGTDRRAQIRSNDIGDDNLLQSAPNEFSFAIEGEIIVSNETAVREAVAHGWSPQAELLLYVVHGLLHLCGYDDLTEETRPVMRCRERELLAIWGFCPTGLEP